MSAERSSGIYRQMVRLMFGIVGHVQRGRYRHSTLDEAYSEIIILVHYDS